MLLRGYPENGYRAAKFVLMDANVTIEGKYSVESTDPREIEIRAPPQPLPYLMPIPPTRFFITNSTY